MRLFEEKDLFVAESDGYAQYRIPGLVVTRRGTVVACCEARKSCDDWAVIDIIMRRSSDGGRTFGPPVRLVDGVSRQVTVNNPVMIAGRDGTLHFLYCINYARAYYQKSVNDGETWSGPQDITAAFGKFRQQYPWRVIALGPGHGIQLANGRLMVPVWLSDASQWCHGPSVVSSLCSDDSGKIWRAGGIVPQVPDVYSPNETCSVQLSDGRVLLNMRTHNIKRADLSTHRRAVSVSPNGLDGWSLPRLCAGLPDPSCCGGMVSVPKGAQNGGAVLFSNLDSVTQRKNLTVWMSRDDCGSFPVKKTLCRDGAGYSDLAVARNGAVLCFYEAFEGSLRYHSLRLARFSPDWLAEENPPVRDTARVRLQNAAEQIRGLFRRRSK